MIQPWLIFPPGSSENHDGVIDIDDLALLRWNYGQEGYGGRIIRQALAGESPDASLRLPPPPPLKHLPVTLFRSPWANQGELTETDVLPGLEDYSLLGTPEEAKTLPLNKQSVKI